MKHILVTIMAIAISLPGIQWYDGTLQQALQLSAQNSEDHNDRQNLFFVDCYTQTCPPCKMMLAKIFPTKQAGDYFNSRFINIKLDLSSPENAWVSEKYDVNISHIPYFMPRRI